MSQPHSAPPVLLIGDRTDPLFQQLVHVTTDSGSTCRSIHWPENGEPPEALYKDAKARPLGRGLILLHRRCVGPTELQTISALRDALDESRSHRPRLELVVGDLVRYAEVQILEQVVDRITPEAVMADVLPGRLARLAGRVLKPLAEQRIAQVGVISTNQDLAAILADLVAWSGLTPVLAKGWSDRGLSSNSLVIWDIPVLSGRWPAELQAQSRRRRVLALLAMGHRDSIAQARAAGAVACLDLPFETEDLADLLMQHVPQSNSINRLTAETQPRASSIRLRSGGTVLRPDAGHRLMQEPKDHTAARLRQNDPEHATVHDAGENTSELP